MDLVLLCAAWASVGSSAGDLDDDGWPEKREAKEEKMAICWRGGFGCPGGARRAEGGEGVAERRSGREEGREGRAAGRTGGRDGGSGLVPRSYETRPGRAEELSRVLSVLKGRGPVVGLRCCEVEDGRRAGGDEGLTAGGISLARGSRAADPRFGPLPGLPLGFLQQRVAIAALPVTRRLMRRGQRARRQEALAAALSASVKQREEL